MPITGSELTTLYKRHAPGMVAYLTRRTFEPQVALDLVGETFAVAFERRVRFDGIAKREGRAWLYGIANNLLNDYFRSGQIERRAMDRLGVPRNDVAADELERIEQLAGISVERIRVRSALERLTPEHRQALNLRVVEERSYAEIAGELAISEQVERARVSRGMSKLRDLLDESSPNEQIAVEVVEHVAP